ncbi:hypothetical protein [Nitratireductor sp. GCM10026969]|uniref:hypothetical protein n=1 Tax=Nitratireductor sp. GCM10026969 TaxID=3252645 RepID=UPI003622499D
MGTMATARINTTQGFVIYRDLIIVETDDGWIARSEDFGDTVCSGKSLFECIDAVEDWHDNRAEAAWVEHQERLMSSSGPDDSTYRRDMIAAGRGHLLGGA